MKNTPDNESIYSSNYLNLKWALDMVKNYKIIIAGVIVYWLFMHVFLRFIPAPLSFASVNNFEIVGIIVFYAGAPFFLGLTMSLLLKEKYKWIYGVIIFQLYLMIVLFRNIIVSTFIYKSSYLNELYYLKQSYLYTGIPASFFAIAGGIVGYYISKKWLSIEFRGHHT